MIANSKAIELARVERLSREQFETDFLHCGRPVLLTNQMDDWAAVRNWDLDYLEENQGEVPVEVEHYPSGQRHDAFTYRQMTLGEYVRLVRDDAQSRIRYYLAEKPIAQVVPDLHGQFRTPDLVPSSADPRTVMFVGCDTFTTAHYHKHRTQALLAQIHGRKHVVLYPPGDLQCLYPNRWYSMRPNHSCIPFDRQPEEALVRDYPKLADSRSIQVTVEPGQMLYIPDHWMHTVEGIGPSISITFFWTDLLKYAYLPGVVRDGCAEVSKQTMLAVAKLGNALKLNRLMVDVAAAVGVLQPSDKDAVYEYLSNFGVRVPQNRERTGVDSETGEPFP